MTRKLDLRYINCPYVCKVCGPGNQYRREEDLLEQGYTVSRGADGRWYCFDCQTLNESYTTFDAERNLQKTTTTVPTSEIQALRSRIADLERQLDAQPTGTRICDSPACTAAIIKSEGRGGGRFCANGHEARWVAIDSQKDVLSRAERAEADLETKRQAHQKTLDLVAELEREREELFHERNSAREALEHARDLMKSTASALFEVYDGALGQEKAKNQELLKNFQDLQEKCSQMRAALTAVWVEHVNRRIELTPTILGMVMNARGTDPPLVPGEDQEEKAEEEEIESDDEDCPRCNGPYGCQCYTRR